MKETKQKNIYINVKFFFLVNELKLTLRSYVCSVHAVHAIVTVAS